MTPTNLKLYYDERSPPARSCLILIKMLKLDVELCKIDIFAQEQHTEDYLKLNPAHTVPSLVDGSLVLTDSHVILMHLCDKYYTRNQMAANLFPKEEVRRVRIANLLFFDCTFLYRRDLMSDIIRKSYAQVEISYYKRKVCETYDMLESQLAHSIIESKGRAPIHEDIDDPDVYMASVKHMTIADIAILTSLTTLDALFFIELKQCPLLYAWFNRMQKIPENEINVDGLRALKGTMERLGKFKYPQRKKVDENKQ